MTIKEFLITMADDEVVIADGYGEITVWNNRNAVELERVFTKEMLNSKIISVYVEDGKLTVLTNREEDDE